MEKIQNSEHVASNLCNETVIPVYVVDNASEFIRKCKPYHVINVKSDVEEATIANEDRTINGNDKNENASVVVEAERSHEQVVNQKQQEEEEENKSDTSGCAKEHVNTAWSTFTNKLNSTQTHTAKVKQSTECTKSESLQKNKPYEICFSSSFSDDNRLDKSATYIPDDEDMSWCKEHQISMTLFQWAITTFDKVYAHFILEYVNDASNCDITSDVDNMIAYDKQCKININKSQTHSSKCYCCSVCGRIVHLDENLEILSKLQQNNNGNAHEHSKHIKSDNVNAHKYGLRCVSCGCVAHFFCWGVSCTNEEWSNWRCKACEHKNKTCISCPIEEKEQQQEEQQRKSVQSSKTRKWEGEAKCAFCGKGCEYGAMLQYVPYQDKTNENHVRSDSRTKKVQYKYKIASSVVEWCINNGQESVEEKQELELLEMVASKIEHSSEALLWCHAVCALTSQITFPVFVFHNDREQQNKITECRTKSKWQSTSKRRSNIKASHSTKHRTLSTNVKCRNNKRDTKDATNTNYNALSKVSLVFIAHKRFMRPRDIHSLECNYCHVSEGWRVRCAHSRCFQVVHPLCAAHYHAVECLSLLEREWKHTICDTSKHSLEQSNKELLCSNVYHDDIDDCEVKNKLNNSCKSNSANNASYWTRCNVYCSQHAKYYISPHNNYCHYSEHQSNCYRETDLPSVCTTSNTRSNSTKSSMSTISVANIPDSDKTITKNSCNAVHTRSHLLSFEELNTLAENVVAEYAKTMSFNTYACNYTPKLKINDSSTLSIKSENIKRKRGRPVSVGRVAKEKSDHDQEVIAELVKYWMRKRMQRRMESEQIMHAINITRTCPIGTAALRAELVKVTPERVKMSSFMCLTPEWQQKLITEVEEYLPLPDEEYETLWSKMKPRRRALTRRECSQEECLHRLSTFTEFMENMCNLSSALHLACVQRHKCVEATLQELQWRLLHCITVDNNNVTK